VALATGHSQSPVANERKLINKIIISVERLFHFTTGAKPPFIPSKFPLRRGRSPLCFKPLLQRSVRQVLKLLWTRSVCCSLLRGRSPLFFL